MSDMPYALETTLPLACGIVVLSSVFICAFTGIKLVRAMVIRRQIDIQIT